MKIKITNTDELVQALRDLETFERYNLYPDTVRRIREAIAEYERNRDDACVAEIAAGLSDKAKARLMWIGTGGSNYDETCASISELRKSGLEYCEIEKTITPLGLKVFAELQKRTPSPERWGVFDDGCRQEICECLSDTDAFIIANQLQAFLRRPYSVRKL